MALSLCTCMDRAFLQFISIISKRRGKKNSRLNKCWTAQPHKFKVHKRSQTDQLDIQFMNCTATVLQKAISPFPTTDAALTVTRVAVVVELEPVTTGAANTMFVLVAVVFTVVGGVVVTAPATGQVWRAEKREGCQLGRRDWPKRGHMHHDLGRSCTWLTMGLASGAAVIPAVWTRLGSEF